MPCTPVGLTLLRASGASVGFIHIFAFVVSLSNHIQDFARTSSNKTLKNMYKSTLIRAVRLLILDEKLIKPMRLAYPQVNFVASMQFQFLELVIGHFCKKMCS